MGNAAGLEFAIAGWGATAEIEVGVDWDPIDLHRGYNVVNELEEEMLWYTMDRRMDGGHELESFAHDGDGGAGGLTLVDGELYIIGVSSERHGLDWGDAHALTNAGGYHREWILANLASVDTRISAWDIGERWCPWFNGLYE